ncbi:MAG: hypothetical protein J6U41_06430 [Lachnospiraceae bacterium]|nr:hypothetical protein [Lachnospiraceae bacterium]MBP5252855.1 hypothetical protein [Lachnospiraceae bacterium]MBP5701233.1 hypothetical protein [Lachnospiraceae bacterium]MBP5761341.1 hypothetical protein [Lachnospiraceae bacterium]
MSETRSCPNCGAPVPGEVCQYCGTVFQSDLTDHSGNYPEVVCRSAKITFHEIRFYLSLIAFSLIAVICIITQADYMDAMLFALIFSLPGIVIGIVLIKKLMTGLLLTINGTDGNGEVYGYKDDSVRYGDEFCQIAKVLVSGPDGRKILLVPLNKTSRPYPLNSSVKIRTYKDFAKITKFTLV